MIYRVKGNGIVDTLVRVYDEREDEYLITVTKLVDGEQRITKDRISRHLFKVCIETGYLIEVNGEDVRGAHKLSA